MIHRHNHNAFTVFTDVLILILCTFVLMISLLILNVTVTKKKEGEKPKGEYLITLTWDDNRDVDLDLWLRGPLNETIYYNNREDTNMSLDRDSRGFITNRTVLPNGQIVYSGNREVITIRAIIPGDYLVDVNYFAGQHTTSGTSYNYPEDPDAGIDANVQVEKVNPQLVQVAGAKIHLSQVHESQNVIYFHVNEDGSVQILPTPPGNFIDGLTPG